MDSQVYSSFKVHINYVGRLNWKKQLLTFLFVLV